MSSISESSVRRACESCRETVRRKRRASRSSSPLPEVTPSPTSLDNAVDEYRGRLYFQPLPLFDPQGLRERIQRSPMFLQWIFLALALSNLPYDASSAKEADLIHSHARAARDTVLELAMRGTARLEISQALCLLALGDILEGRPALALMTIGAVCRLELVRGAGYAESPSDASLRCYWSVFILEKGFTPRFTLLSQTHSKPEYPRSAREPSPPAYIGDEEYAPDLVTIRDDLRTDPGITSHALQSMSSQAHDNNMISFQPSKIWQLIDTDIMDAVAPQPTSGEAVGNQADASKTTVSVQTTFVHPVGERRAEQRQTNMAESLVSAGDLYEGLEQYSLDSIFSQPMFIDHAWLHV
ncbi:hypothetical protein FGSG_06535 [Fusarium graminearum PH-1]|uniref:hypothetical protein n=1 Tax=Gibberella zeae (strain ATCC MYA-4620 / CBS 123657 / FGSC 9075 / NRRL 31084 / PH-1) TaxID=229533 RepID=UPI00021F14D3|nr:hypothetical protein FGSG_06535 [Fusarium graminearum PH-1]ESU12639.1 hypothetical protein FGSG_06535 [Fusarium graminearum PH-1]|eukprot:XP_011326146.1 hypothetical protein FGSG_06535 [Fusarium graminearum PH-1]